MRLTTDFIISITKYWNLFFFEGIATLRCIPLQNFFLQGEVILHFPLSETVKKGLT